MREPKEVEISGKKFILSKFPAIAGREIVIKYPLSAMPKLGDYEVNKDVMLKLMSYVGVPIAGSSLPLMLVTPDLVDNHIKDWEMLGLIEKAMIEYNCSFFRDGKISTLLEDLSLKLPTWISSILTNLSGQSLHTEKQVSEN